MRLRPYIGVLCLCATLASAKDLALVANKDTSVKSIALPELVKICKGQTSKWPDGKLVTFVTRNPASPEMKLVLQKIYGMSADEVKRVLKDSYQLLTDLRAATGLPGPTSGTLSASVNVTGV